MSTRWRSSFRLVNVGLRGSAFSTFSSGRGSRQAIRQNFAAARVVSTTDGWAHIFLARGLSDLRMDGENNSPALERTPTEGDAESSAESESAVGQNLENSISTQESTTDLSEAEHKETPVSSASNQKPDTLDQPSSEAKSIVHESANDDSGRPYHGHSKELNPADLTSPTDLEQAIFQLERNRMSEVTIMNVFNRAVRANPQLKPTRATLDAVLNACGHRGTGELAADIVDSAHAMDITLSTRSYNSALKALMREGRADDARRIFCSMKRRPTTEGYNYTLGSFCSQGRMTEAMDILDEMRADGLEANQYSCTRIVEGYLRSREPLSAFSWLNRMEQQNFAVEPKLYSNVMVNCGFQGELDLISELLKRYEQSATDHAHHSQLEQTPQLSIGAMTSLLSSAAAGNSVALVEEMWKRLRSAYPDYSPPLTTYYFLLDALANDGNLDRFLEVVSDLNTSGLETTLPNLKPFRKALCLFPEKVDDLQQSLKEKFKKDEKVDGGVLNCVVEVYGAINELDTAMETFEAMEVDFGVSPTVDSYNALLSGILASKGAVDCDNIVSQMESASVSFNLETIRLLSFVYLRAGRTESAVVVLEKALAEGQKPCPESIRGVVRKAAMDGSEELVSRAIKVGDSCKYVSLSYTTLKQQFR